MAVHRLDATVWHNVLGSVPPVLAVGDGDTVITQTLDSGGTDKDGVRRWHGPNPMNGPILVEGAEPGDALRVDIVRMTPIRDTGYTGSVLAANVVEPEQVRGLPHAGAPTG